MAQLALSLLGPLQATINDMLITGFESQKVHALLAYLVVEADRRLDTSRSSLSSLLSTLRIPEHRRACSS